MWSGREGQTRPSTRLASGGHWCQAERGGRYHRRAPHAPNLCRPRRCHTAAAARGMAPVPVKASPVAAARGQRPKKNRGELVTPARGLFFFGTRTPRRRHRAQAAARPRRAPPPPPVPPSAPPPSPRQRPNRPRCALRRPARVRHRRRAAVDGDPRGGGVTPHPRRDRPCARQTAGTGRAAAGGRRGPRPRRGATVRWEFRGIKHVAIIVRSRCGFPKAARHWLYIHWITAAAFWKY